MQIIGSASFLIEEASTGTLQPMVLPHAMLGEGTTTALFGTWHITHTSLDKQDLTGYSVDIDNGVIVDNSNQLTFQGYRQRHHGKVVCVHHWK